MCLSSWLVLKHWLMHDFGKVFNCTSSLIIVDLAFMVKVLLDIIGVLRIWWRTLILICRFSEHHGIRAHALVEFAAVRINERLNIFPLVAFSNTHISACSNGDNELLVTRADNWPNMQKEWVNLWAADWWRVYPGCLTRVNITWIFN